MAYCAPYSVVIRIISNYNALNVLRIIALMMHTFILPKTGIEHQLVLSSKLVVLRSNHTCSASLARWTSSSLSPMVAWGCCRVDQTNGLENWNKEICQDEIRSGDRSCSQYISMTKPRYFPPKEQHLLEWDESFSTLLHWLTTSLRGSSGEHQHRKIC